MTTASFVSVRGAPELGNAVDVDWGLVLYLKNVIAGIKEDQHLSDV